MSFGSWFWMARREKWLCVTQCRECQSRDTRGRSFSHDAADCLRDGGGRFREGVSQGENLLSGMNILCGRFCGRFSAAAGFCPLHSGKRQGGNLFSGTNLFWGSFWGRFCGRLAKQPSRPVPAVIAPPPDNSACHHRASPYWIRESAASDTSDGIFHSSGEFTVPCARNSGAAGRKNNSRKSGATGEILA